MPCRNSDGDFSTSTVEQEESIRQVQGYLQLPTVSELTKLGAWALVADGEWLAVVKLQ